MSIALCPHTFFSFSPCFLKIYDDNTVFAFIVIDTSGQFANLKGDTFLYAPISIGIKGLDLP